MKTAYELAMERLSKATPTVKLTASQKQQIVELESKCKARIAEREIHLREQMDQANAAGDAEKAAKLEQELAADRRKLQADLEAKKEAVRQGEP